MNTTEGTITAPVERLAYSKAELQQALGVSEVTLYRWERRNLLRPIPGFRHKIYSVAAVKKFLSRGEAT